MTDGTDRRFIAHPSTHRSVDDIAAEVRECLRREGADPGHVTALIRAVREECARTVLAYARPPAWIEQGAANGIAAVLREERECPGCSGGGCDTCGVVNPNDAESERRWRQSGRPT